MFPSTAQFHIVLVTAPNRKVARRMAKAALQARAAACANLIPNIESHYWWKGRVESSAEILVVFKTVKKNILKLEKLVLASHPYDTPEFVVLPLAAGNKRYLDWLAAAVQEPRVRAGKGVPPRKGAIRG